MNSFSLIPNWILMLMVLIFLGCKEDAQEDNGVTFVTIEGGSFQMGSADGAESEQPVHGVTVQTFQIAQTETTNGQYLDCVENGPCSGPSYGAGEKNADWDAEEKRNHPVQLVNWDQAHAYCEWIGARLPTESEWEYAARSNGKDIPYPWGNEDPTPEYLAMDLAEEHPTCVDDLSPVCNIPQGNTSTGLCDMLGNATEWVQDEFHETYDGAPTDGSAWIDGTGYMKVLRGGGCAANGFPRVSKRSYAYQDGFGNHVGFRCAR